MNGQNSTTISTLFTDTQSTTKDGKRIMSQCYLCMCEAEPKATFVILRCHQSITTAAVCSTCLGHLKDESLLSHGIGLWSSSAFEVKNFRSKYLWRCPNCGSTSEGLQAIHVCSICNCQMIKWQRSQQERNM